MLRTLEEIAQKALEEAQGFLSFETNTLLPYLDFDRAKPFLEDDVTAGQWEQQPLTEEAVIKEMAEYMEFAVDKAENHRGLSAGHSISRMRAFLWLLGDDELEAFADADENYKNYGAPMLLKICKKYKFKPPMSEAFLNMADGFPCRPGCDEGCGH